MTSQQQQGGPPPPEVPPSVEPYVRALGAEAALDFLLTFGGQTVNIPARTAASSTLAKAVGPERVRSLRAVFGQGPAKVPMGRAWIARQLDAQGVPRAEIAKRLHVTRESVRLYLAQRKPRAAA